MKRHRKSNQRNLRARSLKLEPLESRRLLAVDVTYELINVFLEQDRQLRLQDPIISAPIRPTVLQNGVDISSQFLVTTIPEGESKFGVSSRANLQSKTGLSYDWPVGQSARIYSKSGGSGGLAGAPSGDANEFPVRDIDRYIPLDDHLTVRFFFDLNSDGIRNSNESFITNQQLNSSPVPADFLRSLRLNTFPDQRYPDRLSTIRSRSADLTNDSIVFGNLHSGDTHQLLLDGTVIPIATGPFFNNNQRDSRGVESAVVEIGVSINASGRVFTNPSGSGVLSDDEESAPLAGVRVFADANGNRQWDASEPFVFSDSGGQFEFRGLLPGTYQLMADPAWTNPLKPVPPGAAPWHGYVQTTDYISVNTQFLSRPIASTPIVGPNEIIIRSISASAQGSDSRIGLYELSTIIATVEETTTASANSLSNWDVELTWKGGSVVQPPGDISNATAGATLKQTSSNGTVSFKGLLPVGMEVRRPGGGDPYLGPGEYRVRQIYRPGWEQVNNLENTFNENESDYIPTGNLAGAVTVGEIAAGQLAIVVANDLSAQRVPASSVSVLTRNNNGTWRRKDYVLPGLLRPQDVKLIKLDPTANFPDIVVSAVGNPSIGVESPQGVYVLKNDGNGQFTNGGFLVEGRTPRPSAEAIRLNVDNPNRIVAASDLDSKRADGPVDTLLLDSGFIAVANMRSDNVLIRSISGGIAGPDQFLKIGREPLKLAKGNFGSTPNGQKDDLVIAHFDGFVDIVIDAGRDAAPEVISQCIGQFGPGDVTVADFNDDGFDDILVSNWEGRTSVAGSGSSCSEYVGINSTQSVRSVMLLRRPQGEEAAGEVLFDRVVFAHGGNAVASGNINGLAGEIFTDVIVADRVTGEIYVYVNRSTVDQTFPFGKSPEDRFGFKVAVPRSGQFGLGATVPIDPREIVLKDFNGDGVDDLVVAYKLGGVSVHYNRAGAYVVNSEGNPLPGVNNHYGFELRRTSAASIQPASSIVDDSIAASMSPQDTEGANNEQQSLNLFDVNDDGSITPLDALLVLNRIAVTSRSHDVAAEGESVSRYDVNGDGNVTPLDALLVINQVRQVNLLRAEGLVEEPNRFITPNLADRVLAGLSDEDHLLSSLEVANLF